MYADVRRLVLGLSAAKSDLLFLLSKELVLQTSDKNCVLFPLPLSETDTDLSDSLRVFVVSLSNGCGAVTT